jgi:hypothetical protein
MASLRAAYEAGRHDEVTPVFLSPKETCDEEE